MRTARVRPTILAVRHYVRVLRRPHARCGLRVAASILGPIVLAVGVWAAPATADQPLNGCKFVTLSEARAVLGSTDVQQRVIRTGPRMCSYTSNDGRMMTVQVTLLPAFNPKLYTGGTRTKVDGVTAWYADTLGTAASPPHYFSYRDGKGYLVTVSGSNTTADRAAAKAGLRAAFSTP